MKNKLLQPRKKNVLYFNHSKKTSKINNKNKYVVLFSSEKNRRRKEKVCERNIVET